MINMDTEKDYGEAHLNPLQRQNMRIFIEATKSLMDSVGEEGLSIRKIAAKAGYNSATIYNYFQDLDELMLFGSVSFFRDVFQKVLEGRTDDMTWKDRYIYFFRSLASVSFRKPKAFYNMFSMVPTVKSWDVLCGSILTSSIPKNSMALMPVLPR